MDSTAYRIIGGVCSTLSPAGAGVIIAGLAAKSPLLLVVGAGTWMVAGGLATLFGRGGQTPIWDTGATRFDDDN